MRASRRLSMRRILSSTVAALFVAATFTPVVHASQIEQSQVPSSLQNVGKLTSREQDSLISGLAARFEMKSGVKLDTSKYTARADSHGVSVGPADLEVSSVSTPTRADVVVDGVNKGSANHVEGSIKIPQSRLLNRQTASVKAPAGEPEWNSPDCWGRMEYHPVWEGHVWGLTGWLDSCVQFGTITYAGQNPAVSNTIQKQWWTCKSVDNSWAVTKCGGAVEATQGMDPLDWLDWSPRSDMKVGDTCQPVSLSVGIGGVSASYGFNLCDQLKIDKMNAPVGFHANWYGLSNNSAREGGFMTIWSIRANGGDAGLVFPYGFDMGLCEGNVINPCARAVYYPST